MYIIAIIVDIIDIAASTFGSQSVVVNIESKKIGETWECLTDCGRIRSGKNAIDWARESEDRGAGEIFLQSVDSDGKMKGFDLELCKSIVDAVNIPVVVSSGAGSLNDIKRVVDYSKPSGVAIASLLHYDKSTIFKIRKCLNNYE